MIRFGLHSSLWTARWTPEAVEALVPEAARHGLEVIEIALLAPETIDVEHSRKILREHGIAPTCSLGLPLEVTAPLHPGKAEAFLLRALEVAHALGSDTLSGVTYATIGYTSGMPPTEQEYANIAQALRLIERIGEPNVMIHLDTYHMNIEEKGFPSGIRTAGGHLRYIHLSESDRGV